MGDNTGSILPQSSMDRRLLKAASRYATAQELSDAVLNRLSPAQALERVTHLLDSKTIYDEVRERRLLLVQMAEWVDWLKEQRDNPKAWGAINRGMKLLSDQVERANINVDDVSTKLAEEHARYFAEGFSRGFEAIIKLISEKNDVIIEDDEVLELMEAGAEESQEYIERVTSKHAD